MLICYLFRNNNLNILSLWNMNFCKNKGFGTQESFAHNYPALIKILLSFGYTPTQLLSDWGVFRTGSLMTYIIDKYR